LGAGADPHFLLFRHLQPGGWIEVCDYVSPVACDDGTLPPDCALKRWSELLVEASVNLGATLVSTVHYKQQMLDAGFQNVEEVKYKWPLNTWAKDPKHKEIGKHFTHQAERVCFGGHSADATPHRCMGAYQHHGRSPGAQLHVLH
jgi:hypothetical protein